MNQIFQNYISKVIEKYKNEMTSEYGYRTDFENLLSAIFQQINVKEIEHDSKTREGNKPDFILLKNNVPLLYIENKDIGVDLDKAEKSGQMGRYYGYENLILTDYIEFRFYRNGEKYGEPILIGEIDKKSRTITPKPENYDYLQKTLLDFTISHKESIKSGFHLAKIMGGKAQRIRDNVQAILESESSTADDLKKVYDTIKQLLIHDLELKDFADMYAQTLVYGLFVARFYDNTSETFSRSEARDLIPASNPFLRHFFDHIAGPNFNKRLEHIVNELCEVFSHADVEKLIEDYYKKEKYGEDTKGPDPVIHFYEDFLKEYDPALRKKMGAYYTPQAVVSFIVKSVDQILKNDFGLAGGLTDSGKHENGTHKVQVLDPAVGTGTFFSAVIREIYTDFRIKKQEGRWPQYVHNDLLPRIHGFELMMAPYTIAHLKLSLAFKKTGFKYFNDRLGIYLTNSLEDIEQKPDLFAFGFADSIANEAKEASKIKNQTPIMVVLGNPPYSVSSSNKGEWITNLVEVYKKDGNGKTIEKNIQPLSDDYIKFIRFAENFVEKNKTGIVAMITNNSFIDGIIHRQMRKHLLETFDDIYIIDLHGNAKKKETAPDGSEDKNVFDIMQGVSINIFVRKNQEKQGLGNVYHIDLYGKRTAKFDFLNKNNLQSIKWQKLKYTEPYYFFTPKDFTLEDSYKEFISLSDLFTQKAAGVVTSGDNIFLAEDKQALKNKIVNKFGEQLYNEKLIKKYLYRPFEELKIYYDPSLLGRAREKIFKHFLDKNIGLIISKQFGGHKNFIVFISNSINDKSSQPFAPYYTHPLYLFSDDGAKTPNFNPEIVDKIKRIIGEYSPEELFDYIYAVLHSPSYREKYKEFLRIDFPRVPYPKNRQEFDKLASFGTRLRELHLMEADDAKSAYLPFPEMGSDIVEKVKYKDGKVFINDTQYFDNVPEVAWNFYIGGYQPAQKWLKDRKGRTLTSEDIQHYQRIIYVLTETGKIMQGIDHLPTKFM